MDVILPPELEREIFEIAATEDKRTIPALLRVCHRAHNWIEPLLYRTLIISDYDDAELVALRSKSLEFKKRAVHHVFIEDNPNTRAHVHKLISQLSGIQTLALNGYASDELLLAIYNLLPRRLNVCAPLYNPSEWVRSTFACSCFFLVTHLEIFHDPMPSMEDYDWDDWSVLASLPSLTHLCLERHSVAELLPLFFEKCTQLAVLIVAFWNPSPETEAAEFVENVRVKDPRMVVMVFDAQFFKEDWQRGVRSGDDFWARADGFLAKKRDGKIQNSVYLVED
ncbi:hypothetical protein R3P38DRAFT_2770077 [Favolaschia claudopus]|uniref:F-box domain-containing protein n=1 Tax=Favolaschia claudopus TaxID=2862362 RepID=A0AAW0CNI8_9AGAR